MPASLVPRLAPYAAALASGVLLALSFPPVNAGPLIFAALVPLFVVLHPRTPLRSSGGVAPDAVAPARLGRSFHLGCITGAGWAALMFHWVTRLPAAQTTVPWLLVPAYLVLVAYLAAGVGLACALIAWILAWLDWPLFAVAPLVWTVLEFVRGSGALGFPWGSVGYALTPWPTWIQGASLVGLWGVGMWIVLVNGLVTSASLCPAWPGRLVRASLVGWALLLPWFYGHMRLRHTPVVPVSRVALVQGNVAAQEKWDPAFRDSTFQLYDTLTRRAAAGRPDLIVWPETAAPSYLTIEPHDMQIVENLARQLECPLLVGFPEADVRDPNDIAYYNSAALFLPRGMTQLYRKTHLVPFGEAIPGSAHFAVLRKINLGQGNFRPGHEVTIFDPTGRGERRAAVLICFESIFPSLGRRAARAGADMLVNITNDEWFGDTPAPAQHAWMAAMRAVETGRGVARCANTGLTWIVDPFGHVVAALPPDEASVLTGTVSRCRGATLYDQAGDVIVWLAVAGVVALCARVVHRRGTRPAQ
jgi:apolipoprotein N-acyltransferase